MFKTLIDFSEDGIAVTAGDEIAPGLFEADRVQSLLAKGWVEDTAPKKAEKKPAAKLPAKAK